jgi:heparanase
LERNLALRLFLFALMTTAGVVTPSLARPPEVTNRLNPHAMAAIATVDDRYQSYNIEMIQVMGGSWWAPYEVNRSAEVATTGFARAPMQFRPPTNLADLRLRLLAVALSPAYVRVTDTWANTVYFQDDDATPAAPPPGFKAVITRSQWKGVIDYAKAVDAKIVTSFSIGAGTRDAAGLWTTAEASKLLAFFKRSGGKIAAAEFFNEPNLGVVSGTPGGYDALAYARDFAVFRAFARRKAPQMKLLGPGPVGEDRPLPGMPRGIGTEDILQATGPGLDGVSYHFYGAVSQRCAAFGPSFQTTPEAALTPTWLSATEARADFYGALRDRYEPGKPLWLTETAEAACGGNRWAASFIDSFRYLNQLGTLATRGVRVVMHNTLAGSDYGLIDDVTLEPRPNYWAAVLWRRLMGTTVLDVGAVTIPNTYLYAHCLRGHPGGVALLAINADRTKPLSLALSARSISYVLASDNLLATSVELNGTPLTLRINGQLPVIRGRQNIRGPLTVPSASIAFFAVPDAGNSRCR